MKAIYIITILLKPLRKIEKTWYWTTNAIKKREWEELLYHIRQNYSYNDSPYGILCPGLSVPKQYLEGMLTIDLPKLANDELRLPLYAQIMGIPLYDTNFYQKWFSNRESRYFNCNSRDISDKNILKQLSKKSGRRAFHPYRGVFDLNQMKQLK